MKTLRVGTRGSQLALWQARTVTAEIERNGGPSCELVVIKTTGDQLDQADLTQMGGKRLFVKEIEEALLQDKIDIAVHSAKDLPAFLPAGLTIASILPREDPHDALILPQKISAAESMLNGFSNLTESLGVSPRIGTSSVRRIAQLVSLFPKFRFEAIRGNLETRLRKLDTGSYDLLVLAVAGVKRLGFANRISEILPFDACVPAPGQGAIAVQVRTDCAIAMAAAESTIDPESIAAVQAERAVVKALGGGCEVPIGAIAQPIRKELVLQAIVISLDGQKALRHKDRGPITDPKVLGERVAKKLLADGAEEILDEVLKTQTSLKHEQ